jgi:hypothetical protein
LRARQGRGTSGARSSTRSAAPRARSHRRRMGRQGAGPAGPGQAQHRRCHGLAARCRQGRRAAEREPAGAQGQLAERVRASKTCSTGAGAARGRRAAGPAHRGPVHQALARRAGVWDGLRADVAHWQDPGRRAAGRRQLAQCRHEVPAAAGRLARAAAGGVGRVPERAGAGRGGVRDDPAAPLPPVPVWADELRVAAACQAEAAPKIQKPQGGPRGARSRPRTSRAEVLATLEKEIGEGHGKASAGAAAACAMRSRKTAS